jgi:hypothetical protein
LLLVVTVAAALPSEATASIEPAQPGCCPECGGTRLSCRELAPVPRPAVSGARPADGS